MPHADPMIPQATEVLIRMYGQGVGDCFLLAFPRARGAGEAAPPRRPVYVLIDCGVHGGTAGGPDRMRAIVTDIRESTRDAGTPADANGHLDLLIITHEHWDHLSGFLQAKEEWARIEVGALWTAWTEKPASGEAGLPEVLKEILRKHGRALTLAADRVRLAGLSDDFPTVFSLLGFFTQVEGAEEPFAARPTLRDAFAAAKARVPAERQEFLEPGEVRRLPGTDVRAYVLGPPRADRFLGQDDPTPAAPETFEAEAPGGAGATPFTLARLLERNSAFNALVMPFIGPTLAAAAAEATPADRDAYQLSFPFDRTVRIPIAQAEAAVLDDPAAYPALAAYFEEISRWRRIDHDWLVASEQFALWVDKLTNNTSLVLAFELPAASERGQRKVLLFVGDAQVGNWLSWNAIPAWQPRDGLTLPSVTVDIADLLGRTVFYKVGHHGSHNATLKAKGVERMPAGGPLTAFVPVSQPVARSVGWGSMPLGVLLNALAERSGGRVVLANGTVWSTMPDQPAQKADSLAGVTLSPAELPAKVSKNNVTIEEPVPLWVQVAIAY